MHYGAICAEDRLNRKVALFSLHNEKVCNAKITVYIKWLKIDRTWLDDLTS